MIIGHTIRAPYNGGTATYFSPWFPRMGTKAVFGCNLIASAGVATSGFRVYVQTKKSEDDNESTSVVDVGNQIVPTATADSVEAFELGNPIDGTSGSAGFRDLVRYKYVLQSAASARGWVHFRMLEPTWETD